MLLKPTRPDEHEHVSDLVCRFFPFPVHRFPHCSSSDRSVRLPSASPSRPPNAGSTARSEAPPPVDHVLPRDGRGDAGPASVARVGLVAPRRDAEAAPAVRVGVRGAPGRNAEKGVAAAVVDAVPLAHGRS